MALNKPLGACLDNDNADDHQIRTGRYRYAERIDYESNTDTCLIYGGSGT